MGTTTLCTVVINGTVTGIDIGPLVVEVPASPDGLVTVDVELPLGLGLLLLVNIPCPTIKPIIISVAGIIDLTVEVSES